MEKAKQLADVGLVGGVLGEEAGGEGGGVWKFMQNERKGCREADGIRGEPLQLSMGSALTAGGGRGAREGKARVNKQEQEGTRGERAGSREQGARRWFLLYA
eukprot:428903-Hanusia_phi.AAC.1